MCTNTNDMEMAAASLDLEALEARVSESLSKVLRGAPFEKKPALYRMFARTKANEAAAFRQAKIDECWNLSNTVGLIAAFGTATIQAWLAAAFGGGR